MSRIKWDEAAHVYEDMVSCLLSLLHPESRRIDGAGGDGGRDVRFPMPDGEHIFELKSFTGRMTKGRRPQVIRSLSRAAEFRPKSWSLVVPIDHTPGEDRWFQGLQEGVKFPIDWLGKTWLDARIAERPFLPKYFLEGVNDKVVELLRELNSEQAAMSREPR